MEIKDLIECVRTHTRIGYADNSAYKLPPRFYKSSDEGMLRVVAYDEDGKGVIRGANNVIGITGAVKKFLASPDDVVCRGLFSSGRPIDIDENSYYFLFEACDYDMSFICKEIDRTGESVKVIGYTDKEVEQVIKEAGVTYEPTKDYFKRIS